MVSRLQRNQLEFLKPGQTHFTLTLSRRRSGQTVPQGYSISRIEGPKPEKPFLFEPTGFDFAPDGTAFLSTRTGGIWRYHEEKWNLFADGLQETQGVRVAPNGRDVFTMQKPELTLLEDTDSDGVADLYLSVADGFRYTGQYHEFAYGPVINSRGEMFFSTGLSSSGHHEAKSSATGQMSSALGYRGWMMKVDGEGRLSPFASGFRSPAGIGMNARMNFLSPIIKVTGLPPRIWAMWRQTIFSATLQHSGIGRHMASPSSTLNYQNVDQRVDKVPELRRNIQSVSQTPCRLVDSR